MFFSQLFLIFRLRLLCLFLDNENPPITSNSKPTVEDDVQKTTEEDIETEATDDANLNGKSKNLTEPEKSIKDSDSAPEPITPAEKEYDKDFERLARSCEDSDVNRMFTVSKSMIKAMANENFRHVEQVKKMLKF